MQEAIDNIEALSLAVKRRTELIECVSRLSNNKGYVATGIDKGKPMVGDIEFRLYYGASARVPYIPEVMLEINRHTIALLNTKIKEYDELLTTAYEKLTGVKLNGTN